MSVKRFLPGTAPPPPPAAALRIVSPGGAVDRYYMATPAKAILEKHGRSFVLAKPDVFRRSWEEEDDDPVVRPDEILVPGQKFYLVPRRTVWSLRRKNKRAGKGNENDDDGRKMKKEEDDSSSRGGGGVDSAGSRRSTVMVLSSSNQKRRIDNLHRRGHSRSWRPSLTAIAENCSS
ncbi:unnamed protein product [Linum trigynum]|uniref:Uncharacterized protein n=1 Tax=Linum trigynum TaxID=586398 RepID=A0AAV2GEM5_9ROSI